MKKFAICLMALMVLAAFAPSAMAKSKTTCYVLTNFCDGIQAQGPQMGGEDAFLWDWVCLKSGTGQIGIGPHKKFGTAPNYPYNTGTPSGFAANFVFLPSAFNLYNTFDGVTVGTFQTNQPYTAQPGACNPLTPRVGRSATGR